MRVPDHLPWYVRWASRLRCALLGHDDLPAFEAGRIYLTCPSCGRETPGFLISRDHAA